MSRHTRILTPVLLAMVVLSGCFGCEEETVYPNTVFFVPPTPITLNVGDSKTAIATVLPFSSSNGVTDLGTTTYASSDTSVATVDANTGKITCVGAGTATVIATNTNKAGTSKGSLQVTCTAVAPPVPPAPTGTILIVSPATLAFNHTVGTTTCPESIGPLHLSTQRSETVNVTLSVSGTSALTLGQTSLTLPSQGSADVAVNFNCSTQVNFTANIILNATYATTTGSVTVPVTSNIK